MEVLDDLREHKIEIIDCLQRRKGLIDLPWPIGYGGLPVDQVTKAEANNDRENITDPVDRRLNVLSWMRCYYRPKDDTGMAEEMKAGYHQLRHSDPAIQRICGICEYAKD